MRLFGAGRKHTWNSPAVKENLALENLKEVQRGQCLNSRSRASRTPEKELGRMITSTRWWRGCWVGLRR